MKRLEALIAATLSFGMATTGAVWLFGPYGLIGAAVVLAVLLLFVDVKE